MNIKSDVVAVLRNASEPLSYIAIREQIAALDDVPTLDAQRLVADAINELVKADQVERVWDAGRCTYVIAPNAVAAVSIGADPAIEVGATRHSSDPLPHPIAPSAIAAPIEQPQPPPAAPTLSTPPAKAIVMHATQQKILDVITKAGKPINTEAMLAKMPGVAAANLSYHRQQLCEQGLIVVHGQRNKSVYGLPGSKPATDAPKPPRKVAKAKPATAHTESPASARIDAQQPRLSPTPSIESTLSMVDLRAAASDILLSHGADPLPRSLHRVVLAAAGAPESLTA